ncbi:hypothetical protein Mapa_007469 [Marchantia paleacea]|nr:hypothetical protein Mapa_007469 [Marchantia paleacea]
MACPVGSLKGTSPVGSLELPEELLQALTGRPHEEGLTNIADLPAVVVGTILSRLTNPFDVAAAFIASRVFWAVRQTVPFRLKLRPSRLGYDALKVVTWTRKAVSSIRRTMVGTRELDLAVCPILDEDVAAVLVDLPNLEQLILDGCQKLTSSVADALAMSVRSGPRVLSLQRCFRLGPAAAGNLLVAAAAAGGFRLQTLLLSHLDRLDLPRDPPVLETFEDGTERETSEYVELVKSIVSRVPGTGLRILALHNCGNLGPFELAAVAETCPYLEIWMLGGSTEGLGLSRLGPWEGSTEGLGLSELGPLEVLPPEETIIASSAVIRAARLLSRLRILEITFFSTPVLRAVRAQLPSGIRVWDFCDGESVTAAAKLVATLKGCSMPLDDKGHQLSAGEYSVSPDWGIGLDWIPEDLRNTIHLAEPSADEMRQGHSGNLDERWDSSADDMLLALKAATNCSGFRRRTPLHTAAARGDSHVTAKLLFIGASAKKTKDSDGATALFLAAESGHAQVCNLLLKAGADVLSRNRSGETPLYISALRGHSDAVGVMLAHCHERGVNWQDADVYGDGWTPLMAATVADRQAVAKVLLDFALSSGENHEETQSSKLDLTVWFEDRSNIEAAQSSTKLPCLEVGVTNQCIGWRRISAPPLVDAQNRYGQTALHIAARKASTWFVDSLLHAGASLDVKDKYGLRPIDVARKLQHSAIEESMKKWQETQAKSTTGSTSGKTSRKRKSKLKKAAAAAEDKIKASAEAHAAAVKQEKMRADVEALEASILQFDEEEYAEVLAGPGDKEFSFGSLSM